MKELTMKELDKVSGGIAMTTLFLIGWGGAALAGWATSAKIARKCY